LLFTTDKQQVGGIACSYQTSCIVYTIILLVVSNHRSQSALPGGRVSTVNCHKQLVQFIRNAISNTCLVFNKTKMDFLAIQMKGTQHLMTRASFYCSKKV